MSEYLFQYEKVNPTTWAYLSSLLMIGLFFKFNRFWSVRNLDLILLILLAPGLLLVQAGVNDPQPASVAGNAPLDPGLYSPGDVSSHPSAGTPRGGMTPPFLSTTADFGPLEEADMPESEDPMPPEDPQREAAEDLVLTVNREPGNRIERMGYIWLLAACGVLLLRMMLDSTMVRRPLLDPNLSVGGLAFLGVSLFIFLMANVIVSPPSVDTTFAHRPGYPLLHVLPAIPTASMSTANAGNVADASADNLSASEDAAEASAGRVATAKALAILRHLAVVLGIVFIGYRHFDNIRVGIGSATLYLMLPYTATMTGHVGHVLPAALLIWAVACYRRPLMAGMLLGLAAGFIYYPLFLLPLWIAFYWERGLLRFLSGVFSMLVVLVLVLLWSAGGQIHAFWEMVQQMFALWLPVRSGLTGFWEYFNPVYRYPVLAAFVVLSISFAIWPAQKNLGTLLSCSCAVMLATQFWHGWNGGTYMAWYLPLLLMTIFRPNLEDRVALTVLGQGWLARCRAHLPAEQAA